MLHQPGGIQHPMNEHKPGAGLQKAEVLDAYLDNIECLAATPIVLIKLIKMFRQSDVDVDDIMQLLRRDLDLAAEVLRRCNNCFFGNSNAIEVVNEAVYRLGFYEVYQITVSIFGVRALTDPNKVLGFRGEELRPPCCMTWAS